MQLNTFFYSQNQRTL